VENERIRPLLAKLESFHSGAERHRCCNMQLPLNRAAESKVSVSRSWASLPRGHTGPCRGYTNTGRGYMGGSLNRWTLSRETAISRHSWCRTSAWRQRSVPKPQATSRR